MDKSVAGGIAKALKDQTSDGMFPLVGYSVCTDRLCLLTTSIPNIPFAIRSLQATTGRAYNLGWSLPEDEYVALRDENPRLLFSGEHPIPGLSRDPGLLEDLGKIVLAFGAPLYRQKAVAQIDICGFSTSSTSEQLAQLYSLESLFYTNVKRFNHFRDVLKVNAQFGHSSTGDGLYFWHEMLGGGADTATLVLLLCMMGQVERFRQEEHFGMRLRGAFVIDSVFMIYSPDRFDFHQSVGDPSQLYVPRPTALNAIGEATNYAARLNEKSHPGQILVGDFQRPGQQDEMMTPGSMIAQAAQAFREEGSPAQLRFEPDDLTFVIDKHGVKWHCLNLTGEIPSTIDGVTHRQEVGLGLDRARQITEYSFDSDPWDRSRLSDSGGRH